MPSRIGLTARLILSALLLPFALGVAWGDTPGYRLQAVEGVKESMVAIMARQAASPPPKEHPDHELVYPNRDRLPQNPLAPAVSRFPAADAEKERAMPELEPKIHTTGLSFDGATLTDTGAFPPDSMGSVGPTQFIVFVNGRIRSFTKAGVADGVLNADPDVFFNSVRTPVAGAVVLDFTSDPQIRYDRFTARWFMTIIDVPCTNATCTTTAANRWMVAVSDAASNGTITGSTVWTFFQFQPDPGTSFLDYPSLGIDVNALYTGGSIFTSAGAFVGTNGYVIQKASILGAGPMVVTSFPNLAAGAGAGPESPRGVDNFDPGGDRGVHHRPRQRVLQHHHVPADQQPGVADAHDLRQHRGHRADDDDAPIRCDAPREHRRQQRPPRLAGRPDLPGDDPQRPAVDGAQLPGERGRRGQTPPRRRATASRWYEFQNLTTTPTLVQSGTVFDNAATLAAARQYFIPTVTVTGQGHSVLGITMAGTPVGRHPGLRGAPGGRHPGHDDRTADGRRGDLRNDDGELQPAGRSGAAPPLGGLLVHRRRSARRHDACGRSRSTTRR